MSETLRTYIARLRAQAQAHPSFSRDKLFRAEHRAMIDRAELLHAERAADAAAEGELVAARLTPEQEYLLVAYFQESLDRDDLPDLLFDHEELGAAFLQALNEFEHYTPAECGRLRAEAADYLAGVAERW